MGDFDKTVGVLLLGLFINTLLYGFVLYQFIVYRNTKFNDPLWIKALVGTLFFVDTLHSAVAIYSGWETCVTNYANPASLAVVSWTIPFTAVATSVAAILTQGFLAHRVHKLTQDMRLVAVIVSFSVVAFVFGVYSGIRSGIIHEQVLRSLVKNFAPLEPFVISWLGFQTAADLTITVILTFILARSKTGFRKTDTIINRMIRGAVQTGLFASIFALGDLFSFVLHRDTLLYAMFAYPIGRIYTNTLLDTLNSRKKLMEKAEDIEDDDSDVEGKGYKMKNASQTFAAPQTTVDAKQTDA